VNIAPSFCSCRQTTSMMIHHALSHLYNRMFHSILPGTDHLYSLSSTRVNPKSYVCIYRLSAVTTVYLSAGLYYFVRQDNRTPEQRQRNFCPIQQGFVRETNPHIDCPWTPGTVTAGRMSGIGEGTTGRTAILRLNWALILTNVSRETLVEFPSIHKRLIACELLSHFLEY